MPLLEFCDNNKKKQQKLYEKTNRNQALNQTTQTYTTTHTHTSTHCLAAK